MRFRSLGTTCLMGLSGLLAPAWIGLSDCNIVCADEPAARFLGRLRDEGLYEMGLKYLDIGAAKNRLPASMKEDLPLERVILLQDSLKTMKTLQQRDERIAAIENGFKEFISGFPKHPRRSEAQTKYGDLLLSRAQTALDDSKKDENKANIESLRAKARGYFDQAHGLYAKIIEELVPILDSMAGDKIKPNDVAGRELRDRYRNEYRQAQILEAKMMEFISQTYEPQSAEWKDWLTKSEAAFNELIDKKLVGSKEAGWKMLSLLYRGEVQSQLGKVEEARDSFVRVAETDFKTWKIQAISGIVRLDASEKSGKYEVGIDKGEETLKTANSNDRVEPVWLDLQLAIAEARLAWSKKLEDKKDEGKFKNNRRMARELLQTIVKRPGPHQTKAKKLLNDLGVETVEKADEKIPDTKTFADALKVARERLERGESAEATLPIVEQQGNDDQVAGVKDDIARDRRQAIEVYSRALRLFKDKDSREDLLEAKFLLSYLYLKTEQYWESVALSQELMISGKGTDKALRSGGFALMGLSKLIAEAPADRQASLLPALESLARKLLAIAPDSEEGGNAVELLVKLALLNKRYDEAEKFVAMGSGKGGAGASILGQLLWADYRTKVAEHRSSKTELSAEEQSLKPRAERLLRATWDDLPIDKMDKNLVMGCNALANIYLSNDRIDEALLILNDASKGASHLAETTAGIEPSIKLEALRLKLQALVQAAGNGTAPLSADDVAAIVNKMKELSAADESLLIRALSNLAVDLKSKLDATTDLEQKAKLASAFGVLIQQLISVSSDIGTLDNAGTAIFSVASAMLKTPSMVDNGKQLMAISEEAFSKVATKSEADLIAAGRKPDDFQFKLALAKSGAGKFEEAHKIFVQSLTKSASNLTIQVEAARNLQSWSAGTNVDLLNKSYRGTEPDAKKKNIVWGWGQISQVTSSRINQFKDVFFESRYNIAKCLRLIGLTETDPAKKKTKLEAAVDSIRKTYKTYPELGGPEHLPNYEKLLLELQRDLGQPGAGLAAFNTPAAANKE